MSKRTDRHGAGSVRAGAYTGLSTLLVSGVAGVVGIVIAREFGRSDETDGLLAAYGVFIVITIAAQAMRIAALPQLARARDEGRLAGEVAADALALALFAVPLIVAAEVGAEAFADLLTGGGSVVAQDTAADVLRWMVPAATAYLFAGLAASGLAALNDYGTAAIGYAAGSAAGLTLILARVDEDGVIAVAWGMTLNGAISVLVPASVLTARAIRSRMPPAALRPPQRALGARLKKFGRGAVLPLGLQVLYVICLPFAGGLGPGAATTFVYAYLTAASLVAVTAGSLGLVTSVPLTRLGLDSTASARHVVATAWLALSVAGATAGVFAVAGGAVVEAVLGATYGGEVGADLGRLVVVLSPWIVTSVGVAVAFPLVFVDGRTRWLPWIALTAVVVQLPLATLGAAALELEGLALALTVSTALVLCGLLAVLGSLGIALPRLVGAAAIIAAFAVVAFTVPALLLGSVAAAIVGALVYVLLLATIRPPGLVASWHYLRGL